MEESKLLLDYPAKELLIKFGKGSHKPGSGSAAALQGMLAAQLMHTVIELTNDEKHRSRYEKSLAELLKISQEITNKIYPSLETLFQKDSVLFDRVIKLRLERDAATDAAKKQQLNTEALVALKPATDILIDIGRNCIHLVDSAAFLFDNAFKPARGDSGVALNGALGAVAGCLSIIDLNLSSFGSDEWAVATREKAEELRNDYDNLAADARKRVEDFRVASLQKSFTLAKSDLNSGRWEGVNLSDFAIEALAEHTTNLLWNFRDLIWEKDVPKTPHEALKPDIVIRKILEYQLVNSALEYHEENGVTYQTAGKIDKTKRTVSISAQLSAEVRNFTLAHELGHALLHDDLGVLHRDRPMDGSIGLRDPREIQANKFAACFLMPAKTVRLVFSQVFGIEKFILNDDTVFRFGRIRLNDFRRRYKDQRSISRFVSRYNGQTYQPIHKIFGVSVTAMAIRLEELGLILV